MLAACKLLYKDKFTAATLPYFSCQGEYGDKSTNEQILWVRIDRVKKRFVEEGIESLERRPTTGNMK